MMIRRNVWLTRLSIFAIILLLALVPACSSNDTPAEEPAEEPMVEEPVAEEPVAEPEADLISDNESLSNLFRRSEELDEYSYDVSFSSAGVEQGAMSFYMKGDKNRMEGEADGQETLMISDGEFMYMGTIGGQFMKTPIDSEDATGEAGGAPSMDSFTEDDSADNMNFIGYEEYEGFNCPVAEMKDPEDGSMTTFWLHPEYGFPLKVVSEGATEEESFTMLVTNFSTDKISDDMFELPADADIMDMSSMFEDMTEGMEGMEGMDE
ncbi:hypothetical protein JR334_06425 [Clostridia bacterium]|nr:hypothetical protein JR334_06425 [Clostridia bacterium]